jgi:hypothetical protein
MKPNYTSWCSVKTRLPSQVIPFRPTNFLRRTGSQGVALRAGPGLLHVTPSA